MYRKANARRSGFRESPDSGSRKIVSLFLIAMLHWAAVLAACPGLHELIHHDANDEHHDCAVTLFLSGQLEQSGAEPFIFRRPLPIPVAVDETCDSQFRGSFFLDCRILEHAPPLRS
jgi:hypothetical protein